MWHCSHRCRLCFLSHMTAQHQQVNTQPHARLSLRTQHALHYSSQCIPRHNHPRYPADVVYIPELTQRAHPCAFPLAPSEPVHSFALRIYAKPSCRYLSTHIAHPLRIGSCGPWLLLCFFQLLHGCVVPWSSYSSHSLRDSVYLHRFDPFIRCSRASVLIFVFFFHWIG